MKDGRGPLRTAVATFGFGRPEYFARMLASLGQCPEVTDGTVDVIHYIDGGEKAQQSTLKTLIETSGVPFKSIVARPENIGVGRQLIGARREVLDEQGYDRLVMVEDDIELNPTYLTTLLQLSDWAEQHHDVGTVQVWNVEAGTEKQLKTRLDQIELTNRHFVTYCLTKRVWDIIKPTLYEYEQRYLLKHPYNKRPHYRIRWFMKRLLRKPVATPEGNRLNPPREAVSNPFPTLSWRTSPTSQDAITSLALHQAGLHRITTRVAHAYYFGEFGVHCTPEVYDEMGFNGQGHWQWDLEDIPETFTPRYKDQHGNWLSSFYR
jgi:hypothetical protein